MSLARPVTLGRGAWEALRDGLIVPGRLAAQGAETIALAHLEAAWLAAAPEGEGFSVWLTPEDATALAGLLDAHPELASLLAQ